MRIEFHGAARGVTGSCHLIECAGKRILIDCGLYQGGRELSEENAQPFGFEPRSIDFVLLTHAHLDHCGRLPLLVNRGFSGEIVCTEASRELARLVLADAARVHEEEAARAARHAPRRMAERIRPLYTIDDAFATMSFFGRSARYDTELHFAPGIVATFLDAGHILGSASILLQLTDGGARRRVLFSGDLGNAGRPLLRTPAPPPAADVVVMESTYGDRLHKPFAPSVEELYAAVSQTFQRGGNVVIPSFALERAQELLFFLDLDPVPWTPDSLHVRSPLWPSRSSQSGIRRSSVDSWWSCIERDERSRSSRVSSARRSGRSAAGSGRPIVTRASVMAA